MSSNYLLKTVFVFLMLLGSATAASYLIIIDASGSMDDTLPSGQVKIDAAKEAAIDIVEQSQGHEFAIMEFDTCNDDGDPTSGTIRVIEDFTTDKSDLRQAINSIVTGGDTPIAEAIIEGRTYIQDELSGRGNIILLTDGEENCGGDPVLEAQRTYDQGIAVINIVSFAIEDEEIMEIHEEIAEAGGGKYYSAEDKDELIEAFEEIVEDEGFCCIPAAMLSFIIGASLFIRRQIG